MSFIDDLNRKINSAGYDAREAIKRNEELEKAITAINKRLDSLNPNSQSILRGIIPNFDVTSELVLVAEEYYMSHLSDDEKKALSNKILKEIEKTPVSSNEVV